MKQTDISFLRGQAEHCIALSRATFDLTVAGRLRRMADELRNRASELEDRFEQAPAHAIGHDARAGDGMDYD
jgi:hypothetical protein